MASLHELYRNKSVKPSEVVAWYLDRIDKLNPKLNIYLTVVADQALQKAKELDAKLDRLENMPLFGVPLGLKDLYMTKGIKTTAGSKVLENHIAQYDATVVKKYTDAGAILLGKLNCDAWAHGSSGENSAFGPTKNPWNLDYVPGGSSSGSAAAVAAELCLVAGGTDTGGSIRCPASFCGVVGLKPTYGRVSRYGLIAFASSLDQIGPITKDVTDCALLLSIIAGHDPRDSTSAPIDVPDYVAALGQSVSGLRFGVPREYVSEEGMEPDVKDAVERAAKELERLGMRRVSVSLPHTKYAVAAYYIVATAEASSNLARYDGVQYGYRAGNGTLLAMYERTRAEGFGREAKRRIMLGTYALSRGYYEAYYVKGLKVRTLIKRDFDEALTQCDVLLTPISPTAAFRIGEKLDNPLQMYLSDIFTISANLAGVPAMSVPCGFTATNLPIGMQLLAAPFQEARLLQVAFAYEQATEWHQRKPTLRRARAADR